MSRIFDEFINATQMLKSAKSSIDDLLRTFWIMRRRGSNYGTFRDRKWWDMTVLDPMSEAMADELRQTVFLCFLLFLKLLRGFTCRTWQHRTQNMIIPSAAPCHRVRVTPQKAGCISLRELSHVCLWAFDVVMSAPLMFLALC